VTEYTSTRDIQKTAGVLTKFGMRRRRRGGARASR